MTRGGAETWMAGLAGVCLGCACTVAGVSAAEWRSRAVTVTLAATFALLAALLAWAYRSLARRPGTDDEGLPARAEALPASGEGPPAPSPTPGWPRAKVAEPEEPPAAQKPVATPASVGGAEAESFLPDRRSEAAPVFPATPASEPVGSKPAEARSAAESLSEIWERSLLHGDGRLTAEGLRGLLSSQGFEAEVSPGEQQGLEEGYYLVELADGTGRIYLVPDFNKTLRSVGEWFAAPAVGSRLAKIQRVVRPAVLERTAGGLGRVTSGEVE